jgi:hypothetical protein
MTAKTSDNLQYISLQRRSDFCIVFPEMKLRGLVPNFHIQVSVSEGRNWERGREVSFLGIFVSNFPYSVFAFFTCGKTNGSETWVETHLETCWCWNFEDGGMVLGFTSVYSVYSMCILLIYHWWFQHGKMCRFLESQSHVVWSTRNELYNSIRNSVYR